MARGLTNYGDPAFAAYLRRSFAKSMGYSNEVLAKPIVGICYTPSGFNNCHRSMPDLVEAVSRGVLAAGALPRPFPTVSLGEVFLNPTSMMYRNLMAMDTEEMIAAQPMDAVVLIGGCDKTVPAQLMGAASADLPAIQLVTGPMSTGRHRGQRLGACTDCRGFWARYRAGTVDAEEIAEVEGRLSVTAGTCAVMGTASTMACIAEALGMSLPGTAAIPAVHSDRLVAAEETGRAAVRLIQSKITPAQVITQKSVENAIRVLMAVSGSTNAIVHLTAVAGRLGIRIPYARFNQISDETPVLVDLKPVGEGYMEDFHAAGGMGALLRELRPLLHLDTVDVEGRTLAERLDETEIALRDQLTQGEAVAPVAPRDPDHETKMTGDQLAGGRVVLAITPRTRPPVLGDPVYRPRNHPRCKARFHRQALHARTLAFRHPLADAEVRVEAPVPADLDALIADLRNRYGLPNAGG